MTWRKMKSGLRLLNLPGRGPSRSLSRGPRPTFPVVRDIEPYQLFLCLVRAFKENLLRSVCRWRLPIIPWDCRATSGLPRVYDALSRGPRHQYSAIVWWVNWVPPRQPSWMGTWNPDPLPHSGRQQHRLTLTSRAAESITPRLTHWSSTSFV